MKRQRLVCLALLLFTLTGCAGDQLTQNNAEHAPENSAQRVLVRFKTDREVNREAIHQRIGATVLRRYSSVAGLEVVILNEETNLEDALRAYNNDPNVEYAEPDATVTTQD